MQNAEGECGMRNFDPMQNAEEECGMRGGEGSGELVGRNEKGAPCRGRALHRFMHPHPSSHLISSPHPAFLFCILHRVEIPHPAFVSPLPPLHSGYTISRAIHSPTKYPTAATPTPTTNMSSPERNTLRPVNTLRAAPTRK